MHQAPSLLEAPPLRDESRKGQPRPMSAGSAGTDQRRASSTPSSPPVRKDTMSSTTTTTTATTATTAVSVDTNSELPYGPSESISSSYTSQAIFSVRDGADIAGSRRPSRRRTGPLSASQREKAALIRKLGACNDCRRRRVACHPNHHNMTWEDAVRKYKNHIPSQEYVPLAGRPTNPTQPRPLPFQTEMQEMDIDTTPTPTSPYHPQHQHQHQHQLQHQNQNQQQNQHPSQDQNHGQHQNQNQNQNQNQHQLQQHQDHQQHQQHPQQHPLSQGQPHAKPLPSPLPLPSSGRLSIGSEARLRTPLPSGRNLERMTSAVLPGIESLSGDLQSATARVINSANPYRTRYDSVHVQFIVWSDEAPQVLAAVEDLSVVFEKKYNYAVQTLHIPVQAPSPYRWLLQKITEFVNNRDSRETLKIVYYAGCSYLDAEREMVLSSSTDKTLLPTIRWSGIQQVLEDAISDTLILMDAAYYPCSKMTRREGVLELIAASAGEHQSSTLGRVSFTHAVINELQTRLSQKYRGPLSASLSAAELHVRLLSDYPRILQDQDPEKERITSFPSPLHIQISANPRLPSILLAPSKRPPSNSPEMQTPGTQIHLTVQLSNSGVDKAGWTEWMRLLPEGVQEVKCESPFRTPFR